MDYKGKVRSFNTSRIQKNYTSYDYVFVNNEDNVAIQVECLRYRAPSLTYEYTLKVTEPDLELMADFYILSYSRSGNNLSVGLRELNPPSRPYTNIYITMNESATEEDFKFWERVYNSGGYVKVELI